MIIKVSATPERPFIISTKPIEKDFPDAEIEKEAMALAAILFSRLPAATFDAMMPYLKELDRLNIPQGEAVYENCMKALEECEIK